MNKREILAWITAAVALGVIAAGRAAPPAASAGAPAHLAQYTVNDGSGRAGSPSPQLDRLEAALKSANDKLDNLMSQGGGGRYSFFLAGTNHEYLVRVDRQRGELAFYTAPGGPTGQWLVMDIPEMRINNNSAYYQTYLNALNSLTPL
jgi:hypothetical protein